MPARKDPSSAGHETLAAQTLSRLSSSFPRWWRLDGKITPRRMIDAEARRYRTALHKAPKYIFEDDATEAAIRFSLEHMDALADALPWIRPLARTVWLEFNQHVALRAAGLDVTAPELRFRAEDWWTELRALIDAQHASDPMLAHRSEAA